MRGHFRYLHFKTFPMTLRAPQCKVFWAFLSNSKRSGVPEDSKSPTLRVLGFTPTLGQSGVATHVLESSLPGLNHMLRIMYTRLSSILGTSHLSLIVTMSCLGNYSGFTHKYIKQLQILDLRFVIQSLGHLSIV